jgi:uncharacterized protein YjbI with pentapeptide repeats
MPAEQRTDQMRWRATFGLSYPQDLHTAQTPALPAEVTNQKVWFKLKKKSIDNVRFVTCQFHIERYTPLSASGGQGAPINQLEIYELTFRACHFDRTFLGGVAYFNCRFIDCTFDCCDFGGSKFVECAFSDCRFSNCTAWNVIFTRTIIDPTAFLTGLPFPLRNYQNVALAERQNDQRKHLRTQLEIADHLLGSLANTNQSDFFDRALYYSKLYDFRVKVRRLGEWGRYQRLHLSQGWAAWALVVDASRVGFDWLNLLLTKGGTSFTRLAAIFFGMNLLVFPLLIVPRVSMSYHENAAFFQTSNYFQNVAVGTELFLAFGYTNFKPSDAGSHVMLTLYAVLGIVWYAFLIPVLLRRIYK